jgi:hypothetical protein
MAHILARLEGVDDLVANSIVIIGSVAFVPIVLPMGEVNSFTYASGMRLLNRLAKLSPRGETLKNPLLTSVVSRYTT